MEQHEQALLEGGPRAVSALSSEIIGGEISHLDLSPVGSASPRLGVATLTIAVASPWPPTSNSNNFLHAAFFRCANPPFIGEYRRNSV